MPFEEVGADIDAFFNSGGELPDSLKGEYTPPPEEPTPPAEEPSPNVGAPTGAEKTTPVAPAENATPPADGPKELPQTSVPDYSQQLQRQQATLDALTKTLTDMQQAKAAAEAEANRPVMPDKATDPLGYLDYQINQVKESIAALAQSQQQQTKETTEQTQIRQFFDAVNESVVEFKKTNEDYPDAVQYLMNLRARDLSMMGYGPDQVKQQVDQEAARIAATAMQNGKSPAAAAYELAKSHGYTPKTPVKSTQTVTPESKLDSIKKGLETTGAERGAPPATYSTESVKNMSNSQLTDAVENHWEEMFGKSKGKGIFD